MPEPDPTVTDFSNELTLFTIGHSTHEWSHFVELLLAHKIKAVADVRSSPYSRFCPQYNRENLDRALRNVGIYYVFLGKELGARRTESECFIGNKVSYSLVAQTAVFNHGIKRLRTGVEKMRVAIMCAEKDPLECHRTILVAHYARNVFRRIEHIREDGNLESQETVDRRLLADYRLAEADLFKPMNELLELAYRKRGEEIAFEESHERAAG